ncbi:expressed unknown protein [Ectocarpus siliculosus]|uniref:GAF domain-containing protein n=1 Tax=Ectocarpus siliculosus TaxID=2880 RepID=D7FYZ7_ECTSI|nr:expressed unknown protein [Ectocarpus siliculosus]|eukprot:CBJ32614.1 expressed unknown protein [Ectocarpus siliculosus]
MDVCAAPPPYSLGSGVAALGHDACTVAMRTFGLLSASLFEVVGNSPAMAVRVAAVRAGETGNNASDSGAAAGPESSAAAAAAAALAEFEVPHSEHLGDGTVGVAAQSARPVCIEVVCPTAERRGFNGGREGTAAVASSPDPCGASSTVLCIPVMLQAAPLPKVATTPATGFVGAPPPALGGSTIPGVEVVGVLRAARSGTGSFAGDDARALSAFSGQLALAMVAERAVAESRAGAVAKASREARSLRRQACRKVATLFTERAVAGALLRHTRVPGGVTTTKVAPSSGGAAAAAVDGRRRGGDDKEELWRSVAGIAARALGCERVDLLRVTSFSDGGGGGTAPADLLSSRRPPSRSFRRRSREALLAARASSSAAASVASMSGEGRGGGSEGPDAAIGSWLCVPVLSLPSSRAEDGGDGAVTVCCAVNKKNGRSFGDVDEAMLGTIAALYAVAASWLPPPSLPPTAESSDHNNNHDDDEQTGTSPAAFPGWPEATATVEPTPRAAMRELRQPDGSSSPSLAAPPLPAQAQPAAAAPAVGPQQEWSRRFGSSRPEPRLLDEDNGDRDSRRSPTAFGGEQQQQPPPPEDAFSGEGRRDEAGDKRRSGSGGGGSGDGKIVSSNSGNEASLAIHRAAEANVELRERAERAERMLATTRTKRGDDSGWRGGGRPRGRGRTEARKEGAPGWRQRTSPPPRSNVPASSSDTWEGESHYHSDDTGDRRQLVRDEEAQSPEVAGRQQGDRQRRRRRRHSSSAAGTSSRVKWHGTQEEEGGGVGFGTRRSRVRRRQQQQQLRASDVARMRQVVERLRVATYELEAERAGRADAPARAGEGAEASLPPPAKRSSGVVHERGVTQQPPPTMPPNVAGRDGGIPMAAAAAAAEREQEAAALVRENANLRRRLFGLVMLEELEGRAVREGLLPLTGGGGVAEDMFPSDK